MKLLKSLYRRLKAGYIKFNRAYDEWAQDCEL